MNGTAQKMPIYNLASNPGAIRQPRDSPFFLAPNPVNSQAIIRIVSLMTTVANVKIINIRP
ncbi:hypothetical protein M422DRAFT_31131 [Sphaerobolus stellatus SS14]|uniref:Uncharacterized protein n=1 Tax=Sphaerobolus stellatus (strain SS14) TaxID=990650 RepID=A0A0C9V709_SPHS4|nr:hypothetical protein M422DRAFT_31131 [Sphaerobolus stellatus SS14]